MLSQSCLITSEWLTSQSSREFPLADWLGGFLLSGLTAGLTAGAGSADRCSEVAGGLGLVWVGVWSVCWSGGV